MSDDDEGKPFAVVQYGDERCHDGAGWYYWDEEYFEEGSVGAFKTCEEAIKHAVEEGGYQISRVVR